MDATTQTPPADELAAVRQSIKDLKAREEALRALMFNDPSARVGNHFLAEVRTVTQQRTDWAEVRQAAPSICAEHTYPTTVERIELRAIDEETGEITPLRRRTA